MECKTKTKSGVEFTTSGNNNHESGKVNGSLETKYKWSDYGRYYSLDNKRPKIKANEVVLIRTKFYFLNFWSRIITNLIDSKYIQRVYVCARAPISKKPCPFDNALKTEMKTVKID